MTIKNYEGGHMMYLVQSSLEALSNDIVTFMQASEQPSHAQVIRAQ